MVQTTLFDMGKVDESPEAKARRRNRERQTQWRRRHQHVPPMTEAPVRSAPVDPEASTSASSVDDDLGF